MGGILAARLIANTVVDSAYAFGYLPTRMSNRALSDTMQIPADYKADARQGCGHVFAIPGYIHGGILGSISMGGILAV